MSDRGKKILTREGRTDSIGYMGLSQWNSPVGTLRDWLYDSDLVNKCGWFSTTKRVSKYCIEGERGFIYNYRADGESYIKSLMTKLEEMKWI